MGDVARRVSDKVHLLAESDTDTHVLDDQLGVWKGHLAVLKLSSGVCKAVQLQES